MNAWLLDHPRAVLEAVLGRLNFPRRDGELLLAARWALDTLERLGGNVPPSRIAGELEDIPEPALVGAYVNSGGESRERLDRYLARWRKVQPSTDGETLRRRGLQPGPRYREILHALRAALLDGRIGSAQEEARMLDELLSDPPVR
jgi:tRNA nucleotidyltransferase (CCA-adding enzyme)